MCFFLQARSVVWCSRDIVRKHMYFIPLLMMFARLMASLTIYINSNLTYVFCYIILFFYKDRNKLIDQVSHIVDGSISLSLRILLPQVIALLTRFVLYFLSTRLHHFTLIFCPSDTHYVLAYVVHSQWSGNT